MKEHAKIHASVYCNTVTVSIFTLESILYIQLLLTTDLHSQISIVKKVQCIAIERSIANAK